MAQQILTKQDKPKILNYFPTKQYGQEGDIVISKIKGKGIFFCIKASGLWYAQTSMQPLKKINDVFIKHLTSEKITLKNIRESEIIAEKFLVSSNGNIRYRDGNSIIKDLGLSTLDITYKTAYCSLEGYSDKETCKANGGTWYYSENDSHDSISSTAENQLLTVSQSIGNIDAESTLTYDGSVLQIKKNSDYDDNWQSSVQEAQLRFHDGTYHTGFKTHGTMTADSLYTLPAAYPGANKVLQSDTSGNLTWVSDVGAITALNSATANELVTVGATTTELDAEANLTFDGTDLSIGATGKIYLDAGGHTYIHEVSADKLAFVVGGITMLELHESISDGVFVQNSDLVLDAAKRIVFDGIITGHTSIAQTTADVMTFVVGGDTMFVLDESNDKISLNATNHVSGLADGTEFSVANSAYAGMILGYRMIGEDAVHDTYTLTTSMVVPDAAMTVRFIAPPSGAVEVMVQVMFDGASNRSLTVGLSDNATYNSLGDSYEQMTGQVDETDLYTHQHYWTVTGLTAGSTYNYWLGASANGGTLNWGGTGAGRYCDFIMKVTALPTAVSDFAVYD